METTKTNAKVAQGAKAEESKKRNASVTVTIKGFKTVIQNLERSKIATEEEMKTLKGLHHKIIERWIGGDLSVIITFIFSPLSVSAIF